ncbi:hypothetical protein PAXRUDRAFT_139524, partial [Paxillus rubicundulus Ve08.2h10]
QDWERPSVYAKRIRMMMDSEHLYLRKYELHTSVLQTLLRSCPSIPLLPNLQCLNYTVVASNSNAYVASLSTLFGPNLLQSLTFGSHYRLDSHDSHTFLMHLPKLCANRVFVYHALLTRPAADIVEYITRFAALQHLPSFRSMVVGHIRSLLSSIFHQPTKQLLFPYQPQRRLSLRSRGPAHIQGYSLDQPP